MRATQEYLYIEIRGLFRRTEIRDAKTELPTPVAARNCRVGKERRAETHFLERLVTAATSGSSTCPFCQSA